MALIYTIDNQSSQNYSVYLFLTLYLKRQFLGSSNSAANNDMMSKIWTVKIELSYCVENNVGKGEIACYEQFLLFPHCFQKLSVVDASK